MKRFTFVNSLIKEHGYKTYLEIGVLFGDSMNMVECERKIGVDPDPVRIPLCCEFHRETSDEFFAHWKETVDIVFIDGDHEAHQVMRDVENSLLVLSENGTIVLHDCNPPTEESQLPERPKDIRAWHGDAWKAIVELRGRHGLEVYTIDADSGLGVVRFAPGRKADIECYSIHHLTWPMLKKDRKRLLGLRGARR